MRILPKKPEAMIAPVKSKSVGTQIFAATLARFTLNTARRFIYPFAPALSRGLGVPMTAITSLIAINQVTALIGVFFGPLTDRWGYRRMMAAGMGLMILGMWTGALLATYLSVFLAMLMAGLGKSVFDPAIQAYVGKKVSYHQRARAVGFMEMSWAASSLIGIPVMGLMMEWSGWQTAFWVLGGIGAVCLFGMVRIIPADSIPVPRFRNDNDAGEGFMMETFQSWRLLVKNRPALGAIGYGFFFSVANDNLFVVFGAWMESAFGLGLSSLGFATAVIGAAELLGEGLTVLISDRIGLKRAAISGAVLTTAAYLVIILMGQTLTLALVALFILFLTFEFTIVTCMSLITELHPSARATMMAGYYAMGALGRVVGALSGGILWTFFSWNTVCLVSASVNLLGLLSLIWGIGRWKRSDN